MSIINEKRINLGSYAVSTKGTTVLGTTKAYDNIAGRDADINPGMFAFVKDASADSTVKTGFAIYYRKGDGWKKVFEEEAMDQDIAELIHLQWSNIVGAPDLNELNDTIAKTHEHANKDILDKISYFDNTLLYDGDRIKAEPRKYTKWVQLVAPVEMSENVDCSVAQPLISVGIRN